MHFAFSLGKQPLSNNYPKDAAEMSREFTAELEVFFCETCRYANVPCHVDRSVFFEEYYYLSTINGELNKHFEKYASDIAHRGYEFVLDIGSNDGILLSPLKKLGVKSIGVDPSKNVAEIANKKGLETIVGFFDENIASQILQKHGRPDLVTASSVFTHLENPRNFFSDVRKIIHPNGRLVIEVEYFSKIVEDFAFERFYFDRPHYYSLKSLEILAGEFGFFVEDAEVIDVHGGSLRVTFALEETGQTGYRPIQFATSESLVLSVENLQFKFSAFTDSCAKLKSALSEFKSMGLTVAAYGCPARFSTITNFCHLTTDHLPYVVDDSPLKQGRFSPGMHIPIVGYSPANLPDTYIVFAFEYISSIRSKVGILSRGFFKPIPFSQI